MKATVQIQIPNTDQVLEGVLMGVDKPTLRMVVRLDSGAELLRPRMLAQAILDVGGTPRKFTVQVQPLDAATAALQPVSGAQLCERRARKRYPVNLPAEITLGETRLSVRVVNLSVSGVGLHAPQALAVGQQFEIILLLLGSEQALRTSAQVRHCRPLADEQHYIGAMFIGLNRTDELWLRKLFP
ncbi:MAG: PilZ domain-containing protein [Fimbriimonadales bacterium]|nr:PilZ domain-containing protein [Fimbriimonadales bacterium]